MLKTLAVPPVRNRGIAKNGAKRDSITSLFPALKLGIQVLKSHSILRGKCENPIPGVDPFSVFNYVLKAVDFVKGLQSILGVEETRNRCAWIIHEFVDSAQSEEGFKLWMTNQIHFPENGRVNPSKNMDFLFNSVLLGYLSGFIRDPNHCYALIYACVTKELAQSCANSSEPDSVQQLFWQNFSNLLGSDHQGKKGYMDALKVYSYDLRGAKRFSLTILDKDFDKYALHGTAHFPHEEIFFSKRLPLELLTFPNRAFNGSVHVCVRSFETYSLRSRVALVPFLDGPGLLSLAKLRAQNSRPYSLPHPQIKASASFEDPHHSKVLVHKIATMQHDLGHWIILRKNEQVILKHVQYKGKKIDEAMHPLFFLKWGTGLSVLEKEIDQHQGVRAYIFLYALFQLTYDLLEMPRVDLCKFNYRLNKTEEDVLSNYEHQMRFFIHATVDNTLRYIKAESMILMISSSLYPT